MNKEQLLAQLNAGTITQEQYDAQVAALELDNNDDNKKDDTKTQVGLSEDDVKKLIQAETDRVRTEYTKRLKDLQTSYDALKTDKLSDEEKLSLKIQELQDKESALHKKEIDFETINMLSEQKLPVGLLNFLPGTDMDKRKENLNSLLTIINEFTQAKADELFKSQSHNPDKSNNDKGQKSWNDMSIDEKIAFSEKYPEEAQKKMMGL